MQPSSDTAIMLGAFLGGWEIVTILAVVLILFGSKRLPELARGLGKGIFEFRNAVDEVVYEFDDEARNAGRSLGGIYGKPAAQALTADNQVAEFYDVPKPESGQRLSWFKRLLRKLRRAMGHR